MFFLLYITISNPHEYLENLTLTWSYRMKDSQELILYLAYFRTIHLILEIGSKTTSYQIP